jgi:hypothetical protein
MSYKNINGLSKATLTEDELLAMSWDALSYKIQGSPYENLTVSALAKNTGAFNWSRPNKSIDDTAAFYVQHSFEELCLIPGMDKRKLRLLITIMEECLNFEDQVTEMGSMKAVDEMANHQRMRFVDQLGLHYDYPIKLSNFDGDSLALFAAEKVETLLDLMDFVDHLSDRAMLGGNLKKLQSIFAHGDEVGLSQFFPFRKGYRGFHLPEALSFCLNRLTPDQRSEIHAFYISHRKSKLFSSSKPCPKSFNDILIPSILLCLEYFGKKQERLVSCLDDAAYVCRELMFLEDPERENLLQWCLHLALGLCHPQYRSADKDLAAIGLIQSPDLLRSVSALLKDNTHINAVNHLTMDNS